MKLLCFKFQYKCHLLLPCQNLLMFASCGEGMEAKERCLVLYHARGKFLGSLLVFLRPHLILLCRIDQSEEGTGILLDVKPLE